jgi:hypothetical protein
MPEEAGAAAEVVLRPAVAGDDDGTRTPTAAATAMGKVGGKVMPRLEQHTVKCMARQNSGFDKAPSPSTSAMFQICFKTYRSA